ncbi:MAG: hypothetical protein LBF08_07070 [Dysgonamonadaceae bacterium]|jgi:hypothetical protein|nr:hypothetical protein [Dysgonamonadaceae bacterium]
MAVTSLNNADIPGFDAGLDSVTITNYIEGIPGGRSLDVTGFPLKAIRAGHVVIKETAKDNYKPMPVNGEAYDSLPSDHTIVGVVVASVTTDEAMVGIMVRGSVNEVVSPYPITEEIKVALPLIRFTQD